MPTSSENRQPDDRRGRSRDFRWLALPLLPLLGALCFGGCGSKIDVVGTVAYRGRPVTVGAVSLIAADNIIYTGEIGADGRFRIRGVPPGPVKIGVTSGARPDRLLATKPAKTKVISGFDKGIASAKPADPNPVPAKFGDPNTSGIAGVAGDEPLAIAIP